VLFRALKELRVLSPRGRGAEGSRPFDVGANGPVLAEGASALVVETLESATRRGARIHAVVERVERFQLSVRNPHVWPALDSLRAATLPLQSANADVALCGADSSPERDGVETGLLRRLAPGAPPIYSLAGAVGSHASLGLCSVAAGALALEHGVLPPVVGLQRPATDLLFPREPTPGSWSRALVLGTARGGSAALIELARAA
jgi:3-oxoacyl-[acyl-carrier-protein] synthase II